ncbi:hypothetical protein FB480_102280 [Agrobacterium vitis]|nr:hypothetical protein FB480_102280 [Agrobacterium vitis]
MIGHKALELFARVLAPLIRMMQKRFRLPLRQMAMMSASVTGWAVMLTFIDQPTTRRENKSITATT